MTYCVHRSGRMSVVVVAFTTQFQVTITLRSFLETPSASQSNTAFNSKSRPPAGARDNSALVTMRLALALGIALVYQIASAADLCGPQIPHSLRAVVEKNFPAFLLPLSTDNLEEDVAWNLDHGGKGCLGLAVGDFDGDGKKDFVVGLSASQGAGAVILAALQSKQGWQLHKLGEWADGRDRLYIEADKPGTYTRTEALDGPLETDEVSTLICPHSVIVFGETESSGVAYCFNHGEWRHVWISD